VSLFVVRPGRWDPWEFFPRRKRASACIKKAQGSVRGIPQRSHTFPALLLPSPHLALRTLTTTMLFSRNLLATFLAVVAAVANGSPVEPEEHCDTKFKFCEGEYWQEPCLVPDSVVLGKCHNFRDEFNLTNVKSFGRQWGGLIQSRLNSVRPFETPPESHSIPLPSRRSGYTIPH